jgi:predicted enzyme related to lactoylglutathione lyase
MAVTTAYHPATFCWTELGTTDVAGARRFYGELLGWSTNEVPMGEGAAYCMMQVDGRDAAAIYQQRPDEQASGAPASWRSYVAVASADESARRIADAGGRLLAQPFDVFDAGRMALAEDPTGAVFAVWQARNHIGAGWTKDPGGLAWNELLTGDTATAAQFYARVFGWAAEAQPGPMPYTVFKSAGHLAGGMMPIAENMGPVPPHWNVYFAVPGCDAAVEQVKALGGRVLAPPTDVPMAGRIAQVADPQGATFALVQSAGPQAT